MEFILDQAIAAANGRNEARKLPRCRIGKHRIVIMQGLRLR
jgi:hypothetical protein